LNGLVLEKRFRRTQATKALTTQTSCDYTLVNGNPERTRDCLAGGKTISQEKRDRRRACNDGNKRKDIRWGQKKGQQGQPPMGKKRLGEKKRKRKKKKNGQAYNGQNEVPY